MIFIDFETYSDLDVRKVGAYRYAQDLSTEILCMAYQVDNGPVQLWVPGQPIPECFNRNAKVTHYLHAWNAFFELCIWELVGVRRYGFPEMGAWRWRDTMALAAYFGLPLDLQRASDIVAPDQSKDRRGSYLISVLCKPVKPTKAKPFTRLTPQNSPELFAELYEYCRKDVKAERAVHDFLPRQELPDDEQDIWYQNFLASWHGTQIDLPLIRALIKLRDEHTAVEVARFRQLTGGLEPTQNAQVQAHLAQVFNVILPDMQKATVAEWLRDQSLPSRLREILEIRQSITKTSVKKLDAMIKVVSGDSRAHGMQVYYGAHTGRFAGRLIQLQNLPQGSFEVFDVYCDLVREGLDLDTFKLLFGEPMAAISTLIRSCMTASPRQVLYVADYSSIEARVLAWLAGEKDLVERFFFGTDLYVDAAADIYEIPMEEVGKKQRALGKVQILGCGFGMGKERFAETCASWGVEASRALTDRAVDLYRERYGAIVKFWNDIEESVKGAINHPNKPYTVGLIKMASNGRFLFIKLPSGRTISYPMPKVVRKKKNFPRTEIVELLDKETGEIIQVKRVVNHWSLMDVITYMGINSLTKQWERLDTWGGSLVENCIAEDTLVYTNLGWVPIQEITREHLVHDGVAFVPHGGLAYKGIQSCLTIDGVFMTPDHEVLTNDGWTPALAQPRPYRNDFWRSDSFENSPLNGTEASVAMALRVRAGLRESRYGSNQDVQTGPAPQLRMPNQGTPVQTKVPRHEQAPGLRSVEVYGVSLPSAFASRIRKLWRQKHRGVPHMEEIIRRLLGRHGGDLSTGPFAGSQGQRGEVQSRELSLGGFSDASSQSQIEQVYGHAMGAHDHGGSFRAQWNKAVNDLLSTGRGMVRSPNFDDAPKLHKQVFDIINCGPRHRFLVKGIEGPFLVHNCVQGVARDIMAHAQIRTQESGFDFLFSVHDELVSERVEAGRLDEYIRIMSEVPEWAHGLPIAAEGYEGQRFRK